MLPARSSLGLLSWSLVARAALGLASGSALLATASTLGACAPEEAGDGTSTERPASQAPALDDDETSGAAASAHTDASGCTNRRWVATFPPSACVAAPTGWQVSRVFPDSTTAKAPPFLAKYCLYTWRAASDPSAAAVSTLEATRAGGTPSQDGVSVGPQTFFRRSPTRRSTW